MNLWARVAGAAGLACSVSAFGQQEAVKIIYVNGIRSTVGDIQDAVDGIDTALRNSSNHAGEAHRSFTVDAEPNPIGWNTTGSGIPVTLQDLMELFTLKAAEEKFATDFQDIVVPFNEARSISTDAATRISAYIYADNLLPGGTYLEDQGYITALRMGATKNAILRLIERIEANGASIVVSHSEGNLLAHLAYASLARDYGNNVTKKVRIVNVANTSEFAINGLNFTYEGDGALFAAGIPCLGEPGSLEKLPTFSGWTRSTCPENGKCDFGIAPAPFGRPPGNGECPSHDFVKAYLSERTAPLISSHGVAFTSGADHFVDRFEDFVYAAAESLEIANAPTLSLGGEPLTIVAGSSTLLTWSSTNTDSCAATSSPSSTTWSGSKSKSGSQSVSPPQTTTYTLTCSGAGNPATKSVTITVTPAPAPTVSFSANPTEITSGQSSTLTWSSTNATSCTATSSPSSGAWTGSKGLSGSSGVSPTATTTYTLSCTGNGGTLAKSATVTVTPPNTVPTVSLSANPTSINSGQSSTLSWSSANATSCTASGGWSGSKATSGSQSVSPTQTTNYSLSCTGDGGSASDDATVTVGSPPPAPTVSISANPTSITAGESSTLTWSSTNAASCTASGAWSGSKATSGTEVMSPTQTSTYSLTCSGPGGSSGPGNTTVSVFQVITRIDAGFTLSSFDATMSQDARYIAFTISRETGCEAQADSHVRDVFVFDRALGTYDNITEGMHECVATRRMFSSPAISRDGRFVAFQEERLTPPANCCSIQNPSSIYLHDRSLNTMSLISKDAEGAAVHGIKPVLAGGNLAFYSNATTLPNGAGVTDWGIYLYDLAGGTGQYVIDSIEIPQGYGYSLSEDEQWLSFTSNRPLVEADTNNNADAYLVNIGTGDITNLSGSFDAPSSYGRGYTSPGAFSGNSRYVSFMAKTWHACCGPLPNSYRYDTTTGEAVAFVDAPDYNWGTGLHLSADGSVGAFNWPTGFSGGPTNYRLATSPFRANEPTILNDCEAISISDDAEWILSGCMSALVSEDTNGIQDLYVIQNPNSN